MIQGAAHLSIDVYHAAPEYRAVGAVVVRSGLPQSPYASKKMGLTVERHYTAVGTADKAEKVLAGTKKGMGVTSWQCYFVSFRIFTL